MMLGLYYHDDRCSPPVRDGLRGASGMFRQAMAIARQFTLPVIISHRTANGKCSSGIASFVVINNDGWILTAGHVFQQFAELQTQRNEARQLEVQKTAIQESDESSNQKKKKLNMLPRLKPDHTVDCSAWWGGWKVKQAQVVQSADIALARLEGFDPSKIQGYPVFKDPKKDYEPGTSLCRLGFPFHTVTPTFDEAKKSFQLPREALPVPFFPIDGIFTRTAEIVVDGPRKPPFPVKWIETSSPGLRGQSGGPIFDSQGSVWAIQVNTAHYPLGFNAKEQKSKDVVPQFLNVGRGVHSETIIALLKDNGVRHDISAY